jgi:SAP domain
MKSFKALLLLAGSLKASSFMLMPHSRIRPRMCMLASNSAPGAGMTVAELKEQCRQLGLPVSGLKAELQQRLAAHSQEPQAAPTALVGGSLLGDDDLFPSSYGQQQQQPQQQQQQQERTVAPQQPARSAAPTAAAVTLAVPSQQPAAGAHTAAAPAPQQQSGMQLPPNLAAAAAAAIAAYERQWANDDDDDDDDEYVDPADVTELLVVAVPEAAQRPAVGASDVLRAAAAVQAVPVAQPAVAAAAAEPVAESVTLAVSIAEPEAVVAAVDELVPAAPVIIAAAAADVAQPTASASLFDLLSDIEDDIAGAASAAEPVQAVSITAAAAAAAAAVALPQLDLLSNTENDSTVIAAGVASSDTATAAGEAVNTAKRVWVKRERIPDPPLAPGEFAYFATCTRGLETVLKAELESTLVGASYVKTGARGCSFRGDRAVGYRALLWLRTPHRVMELVAQSEGVADKDGVYELAAGVRCASQLTQHTAACTAVCSFLVLAYHRGGGSYLRIRRFEVFPTCSLCLIACAALTALPSVRRCM